MRRGLKFRVCRVLMLLSCGGSLLQFSSCNPNVNAAVLQGLEATSTTLANILIQALFEGLGDDSNTGGG